MDGKESNRGCDECNCFGVFDSVSVYFCQEFVEGGEGGFLELDEIYGNFLLQSSKRSTSSFLIEYPSSFDSLGWNSQKSCRKLEIDELFR